jgi:hypothetical protein
MDAALARLEDAERRGDVAALVAELRAHGGSLAHARVAVVQACTALRILTDSRAPADNRAKAAAAGAIGTLLHTLRAHGADAAIQAQALGALVGILANADRVAEASRLGAVDATVVALREHAADMDVQAAGFAALVYLSNFCSDNRIAACRAGAVDAALAALHNHTAYAELADLFAGLLLTLLIDERSRAVIANRAHVVVPAFVAVMRFHHSAANVQECCCRALSDLFFDGSYDKQTSAGAAGAAEALVCALLAFPADMCIQEHGCAALHHLVTDHEANAVKAGACGAAEAVTALLRVPGTDLRVLAIACEVMTQLIGRSPAGVCELNLRRAVAAGAFDAVVELVHSNYAAAALATHGYSALSSMLLNGVCCQEAGRDLAVDTAALVMRAHSQDADVLDAALMFLGRLYA